jgi:hypothetical protein
MAPEKIQGCFLCMAISFPFLRMALIIFFLEFEGANLPSKNGSSRT